MPRTVHKETDLKKTLLNVLLFTPDYSARPQKPVGIESMVCLQPLLFGGELDLT
jgi:hypothetical protein